MSTPTSDEPTRDDTSAAHGEPPVPREPLRPPGSDLADQVDALGRPAEQAEEPAPGARQEPPD